MRSDNLIAPSGGDFRRAFKAWWKGHYERCYTDVDISSFVVVIDGNKGFIKHIPCGKDVPCRRKIDGGFNSNLLRTHLGKCCSNAMDVSLGDDEEETDSAVLTTCLENNPNILENAVPLIDELKLRCKHCKEEFRIYRNGTYFKFDKFTSHSCSGWNTSGPTPVSSMVLGTEEGGLPSGGVVTVSTFEKDGLYLQGLSSVVKCKHCLQWAGFDYRSATGNLEFNLQAHVEWNDHKRSSKNKTITSMLKPLKPPPSTSDYTCPLTAGLCFLGSKLMTKISGMLPNTCSTTISTTTTASFIHAVTCTH